MSPSGDRWVSIPGGTSTVGSPTDELCRDDDEPARKTTLEPFALGRTEVTQAEFVAVMGNNPSFRTKCDTCPVDSVTRAEAETFCKKTESRLPTEAEWEHAARAGTSSPFYAGGLESCMAEDITASRIAWYKVNSGGYTHPVGEKAANPHGLHDMSGNVYEWTSTPDGDRGVVRGGSWYHNAHHARSANRMTVLPSMRLSWVGFRCARSVEP